MRLPAEGRDSTTDVEGYPLNAARGAEVSVVSEAPLISGVLPPAAPPKDGQRGVSASADVDPAVISGGETSNILANSPLADLTAGHPNPTCTLGSEQQRKREFLNALYRGFAIAQIRLNSVTLPMNFTPLVRERAIEHRLPVHTDTLRGCNILFVAAHFMIVYFAHSNAHLCLIASDGSSGVRAASCIQMQGGHG